MKKKSLKYIIKILSILFLTSMIKTELYDEYELESNLNYEQRSHTNEKYELQTEEFEQKKRILEHACLDQSILPKNKDGRILLINASNNQKVDSFKKGKCPPVILVPGFTGTKLDFKVTNCKLFSKSHPEILKTCGWDNCDAHELKKFTVWLNFDIDISEILNVVMGGIENQNSNKKRKKIHIPKILRSIKVENGRPIEYEFREGCLGSLLRVYYKENINESLDKDKQSTFKKYYKVEKLKGAELTVQSTTRAECGADNISNILGNIFSVSNNFKGFANINSQLLKMGYIKGLSLFNVPYDFRLDIDNVINEVKKAVKTAYQINKKKVFIISHSYGGLISLKLSSYHKESELIKHVMFIGSPFLGTPSGAMNALLNYDNFDYEKTVSYMGITGTIKTLLDESSLNMINGSFSFLHFFPKEILNDEIDQDIKSINELEDIIENKFIINNENYKMTKRIKIIYKNYIENSKNKDILERFYKIFPKPYKFCMSIPHKNRRDIYSGICKINMEDYSKNPIFKFNNTDFILKNIIHHDNHDHAFDLLSKFFDKKIEFMNKFATKDYHLKKDEFLKFLLHSQEKEIFNEFKRNENIEYSFVFSNHLKTLEFAEFEEKNGKTYRKNEKFTHGDNTINGFSQIYPGIRWFLEDLKKNQTSHLNFIEYCSDLQSKSKIKKKSNEYDPNKKTQHITLKCDCMTSTNLDPIESCNHSGMINDSHLIDLISDIIIKSHVGLYKSEEFNDLFVAEYNDKMKCANLFN